MAVLDIALNEAALGQVEDLGWPTGRAAHPSSVGWQAVAKRAIDVVVALVAMTLIAPAALVIAFLVRRDGGPAIFRQQRIGKDGVPFDVWKFRTMVTNAEELLIDLRDQNEADGPLFKLRDDPRVTRIGKVLRSTSIDELPQLVNVLKGEMSLVGPRPALASEMSCWDPELHARLQVKPGITGIWQVSGRSNTDFATYCRLDLTYVESWSLRTDLSILCRTVPTVLKGCGAY